MSDFTPSQMVAEMLRLSQLLDEAQAELRDCVAEEARAENEYRKAKANAYLSTSGTVGERDAQTDKTTAEERYKAHLSAGLAKAALESVRNRRTQLSVLQTVSNAVREDMRFSRTGPQEGGF